MPKTLKIFIFTTAAILCLAMVFGAGCIVGNDPILSQGIDLGVVEEVWSLLFSEYVESDRLDEQTLREGAINGIMEALDDPYSSYLDVETFELSMSGYEGKFEGIGAYVGMRDGNITIIAPIADSPADRAGIKAGDILIEIEGDSTEDMTLNEAVLRIRGPEGTAVTIKVLHQGEDEPETLTITREEIELSSVYLEMMDDIAYIHISNFTERTNNELTPAFKEMDENDATGIILDLRSNPGGLLSSVVDVTSRFLDDGRVLVSRDNKGNEDIYSVVNSGKKTELPLVILTDNFTASASEVLSGALQDYKRAVVAGTVTYGKGSVNTLFTLKDNSGVYITTHRWLTPNGRMIEGKGITPDFEIQDGDPIEWAIDYLHRNSD